jgi:hypothetical protein
MLAFLAIDATLQMFLSSGRDSSNLPIEYSSPAFFGFMASSSAATTLSGSMASEGVFLASSGAAA